MPLKICILARKRLKFNTRIVRQALALQQSGFDVTVVSLENPIDELRELIPDVRFIEIKLDPWPNLAVRVIRKSIRLSAAAVMIVLIGKKKLLERKKSRLQGNTRTGIDEKIVSAARKLLAPYVNLARTQQFSRRVAKIVRNEGFDICQAHDSFALPAAGRIRKLHNARLVYDAVEAPDERSGTALSGTSQWLKKIESRRDEKIIRSASRIYCIGPSLAKWTSNRYSIDMPTVVRNCCMYWNYQHDTELREILGIDVNNKVGVIVGSIYQGQGLEILASALKYTRQELHLVAVGPASQDGYINHLREYLCNIGVNNRFHVLPPKPQDRIIPFISGADFGVIALLPNRLNHRLALPNKLFEYVMARLPVATGMTSDIVEIIRKYEIGNVFNDDDERDIARCIYEVSMMKQSGEVSLKIEAAARELSWEEEQKKYVYGLASVVTV